jgi:hypothetical protein
MPRRSGIRPRGEPDVPAPPTQAEGLRRRRWSGRPGLFADTVVWRSRRRISGANARLMIVAFFGAELMGGGLVRRLVQIGHQPIRTRSKLGASAASGRSSAPVPITPSAPPTNMARSGSGPNARTRSSGARSIPWRAGRICRRRSAPRSGLFASPRRPARCHERAAPGRSARAIRRRPERIVAGLQSIQTRGENPAIILLECNRTAAAAGSAAPQ